MIQLNLCGKHHKARFVVFSDSDSSSPVPQPYMAFFSSRKACINWLVHNRHLSNMSAYNEVGQTVAFVEEGDVIANVI